MDSLRNFFMGSKPSTSRSPAAKALRDMGYTDEQAQVALQATGGDVERAVALLLEQTDGSSRPLPRMQPAQNSSSAYRDDQRALQQALEASRREATARRPTTAREAALAAAEARAQRAPPRAPGPPARTRGPHAFGRATASGSAASSRAPEALKAPGKTPEERIDACSSRLAGNAIAVDTLISSVSKVLDHPTEERYRTVNLSNANFQRHVASAPGGMEFMQAVGYVPMHGHLVLQHPNSALLRRGKAALEQQQKSRSYIAAKDTLELSRVLAMSETEYTGEAAKRRAGFAARVPDEPAEGLAGNALLCFHLPGERQVWRRFESSNTLEDLLNFARSLPGAPEQAIKLANVTMAPEVLLDASGQPGLTLQSLELWPTGHISVRAAS